MREKLLALLINAFSGVRRDGLNHLAHILSLQVATEDEAKALVDKLTKAQVEDFVKEFRAEIDKEVSDSNKTFEANLKKKFDFSEKKTTSAAVEADKGNDPKGGDDMMAKLEAMIEKRLAVLQDKIVGYEKENVTKSRLQQLDDVLGECKDENFRVQTRKDFVRLKEMDDGEFKEYLTDKSAAIAAVNQSVANMVLGMHSRPARASTQTDVKASKEEIDAVMERMPPI